MYKPRREGALCFAELLDAVASVDGEIRIRFTSPHPKDFSQDVIDVSPVLPPPPLHWMRCPGRPVEEQRVQAAARPCAERELCGAAPHEAGLRQGSV